MEAFLVLAVIFLHGLLVSPLVADPVEDKHALLAFIDGLPSKHNLNWNASFPVCNHWIGVTCNSDNSRIIALQLPGVKINGPIPSNTLGRLSALQILGLSSDGLTGTFPLELTKLENLTFLDLHFNNFSGPLPLDYSGWRNVAVVDLSFNAFNGSIPPSISNLTQLRTLKLANNSLSGEIPNTELPELLELDLANNNFHGSVPKYLMRFPDTSFTGNNLSNTSQPLLLPPVSSPVSTSIHNSHKNKKLAESAILGIIVGGCGVALAAIAALVLVFCSKKKKESGESCKVNKGETSPEIPMAAGEENSNRLVFFEGSRYAFDLEDLLRASAEVLGKGTFGTAYKAVLEDSTTVVVKRLKEVSVGKREFEQQMESVGRIRHENVVPLRAYYYSKDEKLMVYDHYRQGSVSLMLHGKGGQERTPLDWDTRLRIALGAARGVTCIHAENSGKFVHGNIKSSNIFLNDQHSGCVSDLGLAAVMDATIPLPYRAAGYRAPELMDTRKASQASDVYSVGVLLLELLTGKSPIHAPGGEEVVHLVRWVQSVVREEWTAEVFDVELLRYPNIEVELVEMLQIAMACVVRIPEQRPKMEEVVKMIEDVRRIDTGNRPSAEGRSDGSTGQTLPSQSSQHQ